MSKVWSRATLQLVAAAFLSACDLGSAKECASISELTVEIGSRTYVVPAKDRPAAAPLRDEDVFPIWPGERSTEDLLYCQGKGRVPVKLESLTIRPPSLKDVVFISIRNVQPEPLRLRSMSEATTRRWVRAAEPSLPYAENFLTVSGDEIRTSCTSKDQKDVFNRPMRQRCDIRIRLEPKGSLRLQYLRPAKPEDAREILARADQYLKSLMVTE
jgi:hypothetical protein